MGACEERGASTIPSHPTPFERSHSGKVNTWRQLASSKLNSVCKVTCVCTQSIHLPHLWWA